jgi:hypothetical protein
MVSLCGAPDGIRLFNTVHNIQLKPKLNIFVSLDQRYFNALFLNGDDKLRTLAALLSQLYSTTTTNNRKLSSSSTSSSLSTTSNKDESSNTTTSNVEVKVEFPLTSREQEQTTAATANSNEQQDVIAISEQIFLKVLSLF